MTPPALDHVVRTCLAKKPDRRWQNAGDVARELEWTIDSGVQSDVPRTAATRRRPLVAIGLFLIAAMLGAVVWNFIQPRSQASSPITRFAVLPPPAEQSPGHYWLRDPDKENSTLVLSPDGQYLVYANGTRLYVRSMDQLGWRSIHGTENAEFPFFSPDSLWIGFFAEGVLKKVHVAKGAPVAIADVGVFLDGASWGAR